MRRAELIQRIKHNLIVTRSFIYGFFFGAAISWVMVPHNIQKRKELERIFALDSSMRLMGLPLLPGPFRLRLLPYLLPNMINWTRVDFFDRVTEGADLRHIGH